MNVSGPDELSRSTTTVAAGRGLATIGPDGAALTGHNSNEASPQTPSDGERRVREPSRLGMDMNGMLAALLRDFAAIQKSKQKEWGYKRAASAIQTLEEPIESFLQPDGTLRKIPNMGPSSARVILEVLQTGSSPTIERALAESGQTCGVERRRDPGGHFLNRAQVLAALGNPK